MRSMLVTGGAGFIGGNFVHYWCRRHAGDRVVVLDVLTHAGNRGTLDSIIDAGPIQFVQGDVTEVALVARLLAEHAIDTVVHFAAESHVDRSIADPGAFVRTNVVGTQVLLDACRNAWRADGTCRDAVRCYRVSTDEVYGSLEPGDAPFTEQTEYPPNSPDAASKEGADHLVRAYGIPASISNCSNYDGPFHSPERLIPLMIVNALHGTPLPVYNDGMQVRDWLFEEDHCAAYLYHEAWWRPVMDGRYRDWMAHQYGR